MKTLKYLTTLALAGMCAFAAEAGATSTLVKTRLKASAAVKPGYWHASLSKCRAYAKANNVPLIAVWSNGDLCGHCVSFEQAVMRADFINWQRSSGIVFCFVHSGDSDGSAGGSVYTYCWGNKKANQFPFVRMSWYTNNGKTKKIDTVVVGDTVDGGSGSAAGAKKAVAYFKAKFKGFVLDPNLPYSIAFNANRPSSATGEGEMAPIETVYSNSVPLTANAFTCEDRYGNAYAFSGWATSASGAVAYKNGVTVKGLASTSNKVVNLYGRWTRMVYGPYYTGVKRTIKPTSYAGSVYTGYAATSKIPGLAWNSKNGYWTGTPTVAGTYAVTFKKSTTSFTRTFVILKDDATIDGLEVDEDNVIETDTSYTFGNAIAAVSGALTKVSVTGLPDGVTYNAKTGALEGRATKAGTYAVTVKGTATTGQTITTKLTFEVAEGSTILINGLAHADEILMRATDNPLAYQIAMKQVKYYSDLEGEKHADYDRILATDERFKYELVVTDEEGNPVEGLFTMEKGKLTSSADGVPGGVYTVTLTAQVDDDPEVTTTFKITVLAQSASVQSVLPEEQDEAAVAQ